MPGLRALWLVLCLMAVAAAPAQAQFRVIFVDAGASHTCARVQPGFLHCWGEGTQGQLGDGTRTASAFPVQVSGETDGSMTAGTDHSCAWRVDNSVLCWGFATHLYLGEGQVTPAPVRGVQAVAVTAGAEHDCALTTSREVMCWGAGRHGELGNGAAADSAVPVSARLAGPAVDVDAGPGRTCAALASGSVQCWGRGANGELGNGARADSATPVTVSGITDAGDVSVGTSHTCALLRSGGVACWGSNRAGQLGDGGHTDSTTPVAVSGLSNVLEITAGGTHSCARMYPGSVACWGRGGDGELGDGLKRDSPTPVLASGLTDALGVSAGLAHTCAWRNTGGVVCWGAGERGQLGDGRKVSSAVPVAVLVLSPPELGESMTLQTVSGTVRVKPPGGSFTTLGATATLPVGTTVDATGGALRLISAVSGGGGTQSGVFRDGEFTVDQEDSGLTVLKLTRVSGCAAGAAQAKPKKKKRNSLWGDAKGNFQTAGRHGSATVRGTTWLVEDTCEGTSVRVTAGSVRVFDFKTRKTTIVSAGGSLVVGGSSRSTVRGFVTEVEGVLTRLASGRKRLATALGGVLRCSVSPASAAGDVRAVIDNRTSMRAEARGLAVPTARAKKVRAHLVAAITHSLAADRHYRDWLASADKCPLPRNAAFAAAGREDIKATRAKRQLVAAFNPLARQQHKRTWRAGQL